MDAHAESFSVDCAYTVNIRIDLEQLEIQPACQVSCPSENHLYRHAVAAVGEIPCMPVNLSLPTPRSRRLSYGSVACKNLTVAIA